MATVTIQGVATCTVGDIMVVFVYCIGAAAGYNGVTVSCPSAGTFTQKIWDQNVGGVSGNNITVWTAPTTVASSKPSIRVSAGSSGNLNAVLVEEFTSSVGATSTWSVITGIDPNPTEASANIVFPTLNSPYGGGLCTVWAVLPNGVSLTGTPTGSWGSSSSGASGYGTTHVSFFNLALTGSTAYAPIATQSAASAQAVTGLILTTSPIQPPPLAPSLTAPVAGTTVSILSGVTLSATYNPSPGSGDTLLGYEARLKITSSGVYQYFNAASQALQASPVTNPLTGGSAGSTFSVTIPVGVLTNNYSYNWSLAASDQGGLGPFATDRVFTSGGTAPSPPTLTAPVDGAFVDLTAAATFTATYVNTDGSVCGGWQFRIKSSITSGYLYWNATSNTLQAGSVWNLGVATLVLPANTLPNGVTCNWSFNTYSSITSSLISGFTTDNYFIAASSPTLPTLTAPTNNSYQDFTQNQTFSASYNNSDGSSCEAYQFRIKATTASTYQYWNATTLALQANPIWNVGVAVFTLPAGTLPNGYSYDWSFNTESSLAG